MKLKYQFVFQNVCGHYMGVAVGDDARAFSGVITLNETGYDICRLLTEDTSREAVIAQLSEIYDADHDTIGTYVDQVVDQLRSEGVLAD